VQAGVRSDEAGKRGRGQGVRGQDAAAGRPVKLRNVAAVPQAGASGSDGVAAVAGSAGTVGSMHQQDASVKQQGGGERERGRRQGVLRALAVQQHLLHKSVGRKVLRHLAYRM
jgi:hypothetical protein